MSSQLDTSVDLKHYTRMLWRRKDMVVLCAAVVLCATVIGLEFVPRVYEAESILLIEERQPLTSQLESVLGGMRRPVADMRADEKRLGKLIGRIRSRPFLERVVQLLRMNEDPAVIAAAQRSRESRPGIGLDEMALRVAVNRLQSKINISQRGPGVFRINVADADPQNAYLLAKWVGELFVDVSVQSSLDELRTAREFGSEQLKIYEEQLRRSERALQQYLESMIAQDLDKSIVDGSNIALAENFYKRVLDEAELVRVRVLPFVRALDEAGLAAETRPLIDDSRIDNQYRAMTTALKEDLTRRLASGRVEDENEWPPAGSYGTLRRGLFQLIERSAVAAHPDLTQELQDALARCVFATIDREAHAEAAEFLGQSISAFRSQAQASPRDEMEVARLQAQVTTNRDLLKSFQAQLVASDVSQAMELTNLGMKIEILEPPEIPLMPTRPDRVKILLTALLLGPVLGLGLALMLEFSDSTLRSIGQFRRVFDGPILGTPPLVDARLQTPETSRLRRQWVTVTVAGVVLFTVLFLALTRSGIVTGITPTHEATRIVNPAEVMRP